MLPEYDIIVVGAGHAGSEAAAAAANMGSKVLLITMDMTKIAEMSCNPAMGGIAKGQIIKEIDAIGGYSGMVTDKSMIQFRMLNRSKGPAMWSPRAQCDRMKFSKVWRENLEEIKNLDFWQDTVQEVVIERDKAIGVVTRLGTKIYGKAIIITSGTFMNGLMHVGKNKIEGGRASEPASVGLSKQLKEYGFEVGRMKTGTPARVDGRTIDFSKLIEQKGDEKGSSFSFLHEEGIIKNKKSCYIAHTDKEVHKTLEKGLNESPLFNGTIKSIGPRYCPSIENKIVTFADKKSHQLFIEPEGENTIEYYVNGFASSLPWDIQLKALRKVKGLENVRIFRPGYAIEYDYFPPTQLKHTMETKLVKNLYFAGQVNGTTGYEEAGAQGLIAAINAHLKINEREEFVLGRDQAYIGVLIDDLVTKGVDEPYRMFTSRAEYRILLRQDDADYRLTELSYKIGLASKKRYKLCKEKYSKRDKIIKFINEFSVKPEVINEMLMKLGTAPIKQKIKLKDILVRPQVQLKDLIDAIPELKQEIAGIRKRTREIIESTEIFIKYEGYINREKKIAEKIKRLEYIKVKNDFDYNKILSLSTEARQKLSKIKPKTIGQASRISGVSPSDISVLLIYMGR
ncbi:MAG: tRNA uridine-5-carboxymethylaminomethyl(34) synthesis enzyme MnmG [Bacteroidales bacterium]|nr:tRNA uridine-5-carboxymethylaminomethyl(34) synthesis enzyme MnmG [Bacteroidales bacterium]